MDRQAEKGSCQPVLGELGKRDLNEYTLRGIKMEALWTGFMVTSSILTKELNNTS
jgi:hypothetical protein